MDRTRAFIFDMDGTLLDNMPLHGEIWVQILAQLGYATDLEEFLRVMGAKTNAEILYYAFGERLTPEQVVEIGDEKERRYRLALPGQMKPIPGLFEFLQRAHSAGIALALATSAGPENIQIVLDGFGLQGYFAVQVGSGDVRNGKPHPEPFLVAAQRLGFPPEDCLVFEDSPMGIEAARRAGMRAVALATTFGRAPFDGQPHVLMVVDDYTEARLEALFAPPAHPQP